MLVVFFFLFFWAFHEEWLQHLGIDVGLTGHELDSTQNFIMPCYYHVSSQIPPPSPPEQPDSSLQQQRYHHGQVLMMLCSMGVM
jgi:hypothetical protein